MFEVTRLDEVAAKVVRSLMERNPKVKPTMIEEFGIDNSVANRDLACYPMHRGRSGNQHHP